MSTPILSKNFFSEHAPDAGFFSKWRDQAPWAENCLPIYEWQGVLFVGCLFVPEKFPKFFEKVIFVLCDPESLKEVWYEYQGTVVARPAVTLKPAPLDAPDGFLGDLGPSAPEEISMDGLVNEISPKAVEESASPSLDAAATGDSDFLALDSQQAPPVLEETIVPVLETKGPPAKSENTSGTSGDREITRRSLLSLQSTSRPTLKTFVETLYEEMGTHFQKSMVLLKDGDTMKPWNWNSHFPSPAESSESISLSVPSPWRIVMKTHMPYHGYVVPNEPSTRFFEIWNDSQTPDHLTLTPIVVEEHVIGMVLGIGEKSADSKASLQLTERWAQEFAKQIKSQPNFCKAS